MSMPEHLTLTQLQRLVKETLHEHFALPVWVSAEIAEVKVNYSGHCYMELVEKGAADGAATAQSRAVVWRSAYQRIAARFEDETGRQLAAGIRILARVTVTYHELYGFSLQISDIDPAYTLGEIAVERQRTIARLRSDGVWDMNRELPLEAAVQRIAVISSANAAGYQDFINELNISPYRFRLTLFDAVVQGAAAEESVVGALCAIACDIEKFDAVALIRGGGSASDLSCFDSYRLCAHIAQFPLPVITGIGHDKDVSVADMVAHTSLKTPTAVAGWLVERSAALDAALERVARQLYDSTRAALHASLMRLERLSGELRQSSGERLTLGRLRTEHLQSLLPDVVRGLLARQSLRLEAASEIVAARAPERIMRLGFAVVRRGGKAVTSSRALKSGEQIDIQMADGTTQATVK